MAWLKSLIGSNWRRLASMEHCWGPIPILASSLFVGMLEEKTSDFPAREFSHVD
jgi:hypothetical protein